MIYPDAPADSIVNTCFCEHCLNKFQEDEIIEIPKEYIAVNKKAEWILTNKPEEFTKWKTKNISTMVDEIVAAVKEVKPDLKVNTHIVPWRAKDYKSARLRIAGQNIKSFAKKVDYISPMCYSFMLKRKPEWINSVVTDFNKETPGIVLPSIQVKEDYLSEKLTTQEFEKCLKEALKKPSKGVVFWSWEALDQDPEKKVVIKKVLANQ